ncbi:MAG: hypothetical protein KDD62_06105 [Bdellovibrionales bacterium]|nr:hypothetical protein [Bdellovibrionales bacterium]
MNDIKESPVLAPTPAPEEAEISLASLSLTEGRASLRGAGTTGELTLAAFARKEAGPLAEREEGLVVDQQMTTAVELRNLAMLDQATGMEDQLQRVAQQGAVWQRIVCEPTIEADVVDSATRAIVAEAAGNLIDNDPLVDRSQSPTVSLGMFMRKKAGEELNAGGRALVGKYYLAA